uniref:F-box associated beta-propeller type 1 domain-containing protein n=1 Tax=Opuntia streptacantha TaxID=393608 RepID=A0A7C9CR67_OPUST
MNLGRFRTLRLSGFVNGVALLVWDCRRDNNSYFALWNPATREFKVVRPRRPRSDRKRHGDIIALGFDPKSNNFKVIRSINYEDVTGRLLCICKYELYSLNKDTWKSIENPLPRIEIASSADFCDHRMESILYNPTTNAVSRRFGLFFNGCYEYVESLFRLSKRHVDS